MLFRHIYTFSTEHFKLSISMLVWMKYPSICPYAIELLLSDYAMKSLFIVERPMQIGECRNLFLRL